MKKHLLHYLPIIVILLLMIIAYSLGITNYLTFDHLKIHRETLLNFVSDHPILSATLFIITYMISTALSLPIGVYLTLLGGFLFAQHKSTLFVVTGATLGASALFLAARTAFSDSLQNKVGPYLEKMEKGFKENAGSYLLFLRLIPLFPFWLVNLAPAFLGVPFRTYLWTTFIGIIPGTFAFAQVGTGLGALLDSEAPFSINGLLNNDIKIALVALACIALLPILYKQWKKRKGTST